MPYFTTAELRAEPDMSDATAYPDALLERAHDWIAAIITSHCGTFASENVTEILDGDDTGVLVLSSPRVLSVTSATVDDVALTPSEVSDLIVRSYGVVERPDGYTWATGVGNISITYVAGYATDVPADLKEAALQAARAWVLTRASNAGIDDRRTSVTTEFGTVSYVIAGENRPTGYPEVDATLNRYRNDHAGGVA